MKPKYLYETIIDFYKEILPGIKKEAFEQQKQTDNVVVWVAGISTGAIALILVKSANNTAIDLLYLKLAVGFFS